MKRIAVCLWNLIKVVCCVCLICGTFYYGYTYLNVRMRTDDANYNDSFHNMPNNSVDILVLGSSHAQYSFVPSFVYQNTGLYSYVLGSACQPLKVSFEMLKEAYKTQAPELVVLEIYTATPLRSWCEGDSCFVLAEYQMTGQEKQNVIGFLPEEKAELYRNDFLVNHNKWKESDNFGNILVNPDDHIDPTFGFVCLENSLPVENYWYSDVFYSDENVELDEDDRTALSNIMNLCKENGSELLLYMVPMDGLDVTNQSYRHEVWNWATENGVKYIDFIDRSKEFDYRMQIHNDGAHSYINGSSFITDYISEFITENYEFDNHSSNEMLDLLYCKYLTMYSEMVLSTEYNPMKYMNRLINYPGIVVMEYGGNHTYINESFKSFLYEMGMTDDFSSFDRYYAVYKNGELVDYDKNRLDIIIDGHQIVVDGCIVVDGKKYETGGQLGFVVMDENYDNAIVKSINLNGRIWDVGFDYHYNSR